MMDHHKRLFSILRKVLSRLRQKHTYRTIQDSSGKASFSVIGNPGSCHPYKRLYLGNSGKPEMRQHIYKGGCEVARDLIQHQGLVVLSDIDLPADLTPYTLKVPNFVELIVDLPVTLEDYYSTLHHSARDDIRRIRKASFSYEISRDVTWTNEFFHRFYRPSMQGQHGDEAYIMAEPEVVALVGEQQAEFIKLYSQGTCIAAILTRVNGKALRCFVWGG
jgi:hypothetical protein